jgi:hypothetical protein
LNDRVVDRLAGTLTDTADRLAVTLTDALAALAWKLKQRLPVLALTANGPAFFSPLPKP